MSSSTSWSCPRECSGIATTQVSANGSLALFLGTGNATPDLPSVMMERLYTSPTYGMWYPIDPKSLSSNLPPMVVFPESTKFYSKWQEDMEKRGVKVSLGTPVKVQPTQQLMPRFASIPSWCKSLRDRPRSRHYFVSDDSPRTCTIPTTPIRISSRSRRSLTRSCFACWRTRPNDCSRVRRERRRIGCSGIRNGATTSP